MTTPGPDAGRLRLAATVILALIAVAAFTVRLGALAEPLGIDQSLWASAARGMARGQRLYHDVWEQRPPGIYWIYVTGFRLLGWQAATVAWMDIVASALTCMCLAFVARRLAGGLAGAIAASLFAVLTMPAWLYGYGGFLERSVCETFILTCGAIAALAAVRVSSDGSDASAALLGLAAGAAVVLKPNAGLYFPALLVWMALYSERRRWLRGAAIATVAAIVMPVAALVWLWRLDLLHDAKVAVIDFNRYYVAEGFSPSAYAVQFSKAVFLRMKTDPLWLSGTAATLAAGLVGIRRRAFPPLAGLALIWGVAAALVIVVNGARLFNSYFMNGLPPLTLISAWMFADGWRHSRAAAAIATAAIVLSCVVLVQRDYAGRVSGWAATDAARLLGHVDRTAYLDRFGSMGNGRGYSASANAALADYVAAHSAPDEKIFLFGISGAGVYFSSDRLPAHRFLRVNFFVGTEFPDPDFRLPAVIDTLAARLPRYLIFETLHGESMMARTADNLPNDPIVQPLLRRYRLETRIEDFALYRLAD